MFGSIFMDTRHGLQCRSLLCTYQSFVSLALRNRNSLTLRLLVAHPATITPLSRSQSCLMDVELSEVCFNKDYVECNTHYEVQGYEARGSIHRELS